MIIKKNDLQQALQIVEPGLAGKELLHLEQSKSFAFLDGKVITYNDQISVSHPIQGWEGIEGVVQADKLFQLLGKLKTEEIDISVNKDNEILIKAGRAKAGLTLQTDIQLPLDMDVADKGEWQALPENFMDALMFVISSASHDSTDPILTCIHVSRAGYLESSDSYRVAKYELAQAMPVKTFLLPVSSASELRKITPVMIAEGDGWIHFKTEEETVFSCRIIDDEFPDTSSHLRVTGYQLVFPEATKEIIERAMIFAERRKDVDEQVFIFLKESQLKVRSEADAGWFEESTDAEYNGTPVSFSAAPYLLKDILSETLSCIIAKDKTKLKFMGDKWQYMAALIGDE